MRSAVTKLTCDEGAHAEVRRFEAPDQPPFDRYHIKLNKRASALVQEHVDAVFFLNFAMSTTEDKTPGSPTARPSWRCPLPAPEPRGWV